MHCPECGSELPEGTLYCENCGEDIHIVPDFDPHVEEQLDDALGRIGDQIDVARLEEKEEEKIRQMKRKQFFRAKIGLAVLAGILLILLAISLISLKRYQSVDYQMKLAEKHQTFGEYRKAIDCYNRALELDPGNLLYYEKLAEMYYLQNLPEEYEQTLFKIIYHPDANALQIEDAYDKWVLLMKKQGRFQDICDIMSDCAQDEIKKKYREYTSPAPIFSLQEGEYTEMQTLRMEGQGSGEIYYTLDGTAPGEKSMTYSIPIVLDYGETTVKACRINEYGIKSPVVQATYVINRPPDAAQ